MTLKPLNNFMGRIFILNCLRITTYAYQKMASSTVKREFHGSPQNYRGLRKTVIPKNRLLYSSISQSWERTYICLLCLGFYDNVSAQYGRHYRGIYSDGLKVDCYAVCWLTRKLHGRKWLNIHYLSVYEWHIFCFIARGFHDKSVPERIIDECR